MAEIVRFPGPRTTLSGSTGFAGRGFASYTLDRMSTQVERTQKIEAQFRVGEWLVAPSLNRVMQDGTDAVLDFCVYSEQDHAAKTVSRVRVPPSFLNVILARLRDAVEITEEGATLYVMPEVGGSH